ncbi:DCC family protein At1g52590, chloroplastic-like isoform X2 [Phalaenopsis equestris]|uniref:DCC family protein At1g52590, chloroplastic-like isoform X2 n=1 Tax=Phalaenopsis equestris TaxID=78828 RepID=UPI0009E5AF2E|nr:DCC family protein At1g52590, chloroplastic-like isoform X2 [Phalaenopsis equestris]
MALLLRSSCPPICSAVPAVLFNRRRLAYAAPQSSLSAGDMARSSGAEFFQDDTRPIMLFDGVCNLCNGGVRFVRENDRNRRIRFQPLQSEGGRRLLQRSGRSPDDISSVVLVEQYRSYIKSEAVIKIMEYLDLPFPQLASLLKMFPLFLRDFAYDGVANNRYVVFGRSETDSCEI